MTALASQPHPDTTTRSNRDVLTRALMSVIRSYRTAISPLRPPVCRFVPSCSEYALVALEQHGPARGIWLAVRRLLRCHPFHSGGHDPVPVHVGRPGARDTARAGAEE